MEVIQADSEAGPSRDRPTTHSATAGARSHWRLWLLAFVASLYLFTASGHLQTMDVQQEVSVAASIRAGYGAETSMHVVALGGALIGKDGRPYAGHDIGMSLIYLPLTLIPGTVQPTPANVCVPEGSTDCWHSTARVAPTHRLMLLASFVPPILGALLVVVFAELLVALRFDVRSAVITALLLGFSSLIWVYSHISFDATATTLAVTAAALGIVRFRSEERDRDLLFAALSSAAAILIRSDSIAMVAVLSIPIIAVAWDQRPRALRALRTMMLWVSPLVGAVAINALFNWLRFGSVTNNGHRNDPLVKLTNPVLSGVVAQFASRGKGMLFFTPLLILALFAWPRFFRRNAFMAGTFAAVILVQIVVHAPLAVWSGDEAWASRHTVQITPLALIPLVFVISDLVKKRKRSNRALVGVIMLGLIGVVIQLTGVFADYQTVNATHYTQAALPLNDTNSYAPLEGARAIWHALGHADPYHTVTPGAMGPEPLPRFDLWWVREPHNGDHSPLVVIFSVVFAGLAIVSGWRLYRTAMRSTTKTSVSLGAITPPAP